MDVVLRRASGSHRGRLLSDLAAWVLGALGHRPRDLALFERALTHSSLGEGSYERLEFLGDRVLGIVVAEWLLELFPNEPEGRLTRRFNMLVSGAVCAEIARGIGAADHLRLNKQAYNDGAKGSDYVLGDLVEALLAAVYLDAGIDAARAAVRRLWADRVQRDDAARPHPKAALQDWALANNRGTPVYTVRNQTGPDHARLHTVAVRLGDREEAATASTKREAEAQAAGLLMERILADAPVQRRKRQARPRAILPARAPSPTPTRDGT